MAKIVEHTENGPTVTEIEGSVMDAHKHILVDRGWGASNALRMSTGCVMAEYRTPQGMRTLYLWP